MNLNIVMPLCGEGYRFKEGGYGIPKPLLPVHAQKTMVQCALERLSISGNFIFVVRKEHVDVFQIDHHLRQIKCDANIIISPSTKGALCTVLQAERFIDCDDALLICDVDQILEYDLNIFLNKMKKQAADGGILTFKSKDPRYSYSKINRRGYVEKVAEKKVIGEEASAGIYYFKSGQVFLKYAKELMRRNLQEKGEYYISPIYNLYIQDGRKVYTHLISKELIHDVGTPEALKSYQETISNA